jgi:hypothetical protein
VVFSGSKPIAFRPAPVIMSAMRSPSGASRQPASELLAGRSAASFRLIRDLSRSLAAAASRLIRLGRGRTEPSSRLAAAVRMTS